MHAISLRDYRALAQLRFELRRFLAFSEDAARAAGIEPRQHQLMLAIKGLPSDEQPNIGTIAKRLPLQHHSTVELVRRSAEQGLVATTRSNEDARVVLVSVTPHGDELLLPSRGASVARATPRQYTARHRGRRHRLTGAARGRRSYG